MLVGGCGGEKTFLLHGGCFKYLMSVAKRREVVASYQPGPSSYLDATQVPSKTRLPKSVCEHVLGELTTAPQRIECARACLRQGLGRDAFLLGPWPFCHVLSTVRPSLSKTLPTARDKLSFSSVSDKFP